MFKKLYIALKALWFRIIDRTLVNDLYMAYYGSEFYFTLWDLDQHFFRYNIKYNDKLNAKQLKILEEGRDKLYELMNENGIDFDHVE